MLNALKVEEAAALNCWVSQHPEYGGGGRVAYLAYIHVFYIRSVHHCMSSKPINQAKIYYLLVFVKIVRGRNGADDLKVKCLPCS